MAPDGMRNPAPALSIASLTVPLVLLLNERLCRDAFRESATAAAVSGEPAP
jgi:hypothetical protein